MYGIKTLKDELIEKYGKPLHKISIDGNFTCPNRDGTKGVGGCIFCSGDGSGEFTENGTTVPEQIENAKNRYKSKLKNYDKAEFIAYFQSFTGTYAPVDELREKYLFAVSDEKVRVLDIGTRADCITEDVLSLLSEMKKYADITVEIGLQTANDKTAEYINRCYPTSVYDNIMPQLKKRGIRTVTHMIIGLPGETHDDEIQTLKHIVLMKTDAVKFHLLYGVKGTELIKTDYVPLTKEEYVKRVCDLIRRLPRSVTIDRLTGDGDKKTLVYPKWSLEKIEVLNAIESHMKTNGFRQGDLL